VPDAPSWNLIVEAVAQAMREQTEVDGLSTSDIAELAGVGRSRAIRIAHALVAAGVCRVVRAFRLDYTGLQRRPVPVLQLVRPDASIEDLKAAIRQALEAT
jgi:hypothetical protein